MAFISECWICGKNFQEVKMHEVVNPTNGKRVYVCSGCREFAGECGMSKGFLPALLSMLESHKIK